MNEKTSVNDILIRIQAAAREHDINLTYTNMKVYLRLLDYAEEYKNSIETVSDFHGIRFDVTTLVLARYCSVAPQTITESLRKLKDCGIITYITNKPNPSTVKLYKRYYE